MELAVWSLRALVVKVATSSTQRASGTWRDMPPPPKISLLEMLSPGLAPLKSEREGNAPYFFKWFMYVAKLLHFQTGKRNLINFYSVWITKIKSECLDIFDNTCTCISITIVEDWALMWFVFWQRSGTREGPCLPSALPPSTWGVEDPPARNLWDCHDLCWGGCDPRSHPSPSHRTLQHGGNTHQLQGAGQLSTLLWNR